MDYLTPVIISIIFYAFVNVFIQNIISPPAKSSDKEKRDHIGQHISLIHSCISVTWALIVYVNDNGIDYTSPTTNAHVLVLGHSMGYFTYDIIYAEIFGLHDTAMRFHHLFVMLGGFPLYFSSNGGNLGATCLIMTELSNPPMQIRMIMKSKGITDTSFFKLMELIFAFIF